MPWPSGAGSTAYRRVRSRRPTKNTSSYAWEAPGPRQWWVRKGVRGSARGQRGYREALVPATSHGGGCCMFIAYISQDVRSQWRPT